MTDRAGIERVLRNLYDARIDGRLDDLCRVFADDVQFRIAGANQGKSIDITASGQGELHTWLAMLVRTFRISDFARLDTIVDGASVAVRWRANVHSRITGVSVATEFVDILSIRDGRVISYREWFVPS